MVFILQWLVEMITRFESGTWRTLLLDLSLKCEVPAKDFGACGYLRMDDFSDSKRKGATIRYTPIAAVEDLGMCSICMTELGHRSPRGSSLWKHWIRSTAGTFVRPRMPTSGTW